VPNLLGRVERDQRGVLWAVLYHGDEVSAREQVRSARRGRRRVTDMLLAALDAGQPHWRTRFAEHRPPLHQHTGGPVIPGAAVWHHVRGPGCAQRTRNARFAELTVR